MIYIFRRPRTSCRRAAQALYRPYGNSRMSPPFSQRQNSSPGSFFRRWKPKASRSRWCPPFRNTSRIHRNNNRSRAWKADRNTDSLCRKARRNPCRCICRRQDSSNGTAASASISVIVANNLHVNLFFTSLIVAAIVASLTIGGKAIGKTFAINKSNIIIYESAKVVSLFYHPKQLKKKKR